VAAGTLVLVHVTLALLRYRSALIWRAVEGVPLHILAHGQPLRAGMRAERINQKSLAGLLRIHGVDAERWNEVRAAYVENQGPLSVLREPAAQSATRSDLARVPGGRT
jgi:uncharacterized membrane protein YcaP (DUF421 family)